MEELNINPGFGNPGPGSNENEEIAQMSFFQRLIGIIISPSETIKCLIAKPRILFPILITAFSMLGLYLLRFPLYSEWMKSALEAAMVQQPNAQVTPEQMASYMPLMIIGGLVGTPFGMVFNWLAGTAILFGIMKLFKGEGSFKQYLSITGYAYVIMSLYYILTLVISYFTGNLNFNSSLTNLTNLLAPGMKGSFLYGIIRQIDLFKIWEYAVIGIGTVFVSKVSKAKVYSALSLIYLITILISANSMKIM